MASKHVLAAVLLVALVALASATTYTTTVTTTSFDDDESSQGGSTDQCRQQVQRRRFRDCQRYLSPGRRSSGDEDQDDIVLEMSTDNPDRQQQSLRACCRQLQGVNEQCRCEAIRKAVREQQRQQEGGAWREEQRQEVYGRATSLPAKCRMTPQRCEIREVFV